MTASHSDGAPSPLVAPFGAMIERTGAASILIGLGGDAHTIVAANEGFLALTERGAGQIVGRTLRSLQDDAGDLGFDEKLRDAMERGGEYATEILTARPDGRSFWNAVHFAPLYAEDGDTAFYLGTCRDVTEAVELRRAADQAKESLSTALAVSRAVGTFDWDVKADRLAVDAQFAAAFGIEPGLAAEGLPVADFQAAIDEADRARVVEATNRAVETGAPFEEEYGVTTLSGDHRWLMGRGRCVKESGGEDCRFTGVVVDITARREAELALHRTLETATLTLKEVDHRVKNLFALVPSLVTLSARGTDDVETLVRTIHRRVAALSRAHSLTLQLATASEGFDVRALIEAVLEPYAVAEAFELEGPAHRLPPSSVNVMALTLHELATNAAKYGALAARGGKVRLDWAPTRGASPCLVVAWREIGGATIAAPPDRLGFGTQLIERLVRSTGGDLALDWRPDGLTARISLPIEDDGLCRDAPDGPEGEGGR